MLFMQLDISMIIGIKDMLKKAKTTHILIQHNLGHQITKVMDSQKQVECPNYFTDKVRAT